MNFNDFKRGTGSVYPDGAIAAAGGFERVESFLTPKIFRDRFLFGLPLISPTTREKITDSMLEDFIKRGANLAELDAQIDIFPIVRRIRLPYDKNHAQQFIFLQVPHKPIQKIFRLAICSASYDENDPNKYPSGLSFYEIPKNWIEMGNARKGRLNVLPFHPTTTVNSAIMPSQLPIGAMGSPIIYFFSLLPFLPAFWTIEALFGFCSEDGQVPVIINELVGMRAAMLIIDNLIPLFRTTSQSLSIDGLGQSTADNLSNFLIQKRTALQEQYFLLVEKIKGLTNNKIVSGHV